jgi:3,4-dihydroxy-9,10-secoandrosta-1,3,5(10)-triene-9,17-dione 4,5-dioxygenase
MGTHLVTGLGYVVVGSSKPGDWESFGSEILGAVRSSVTLRDGLALRLDDHLARIIVEPGDDGVKTVGWEVGNLPAWEAVLERLVSLGVSYELLGQDRIDGSRCASEVCCLLDPSGNSIELVFSPFIDPVDSFVSPAGARFVTGVQGMGHVTHVVANYAETVQFYKEVLGFSVRETIDAPPLRATFLGCNPRQHSLALVDGQGVNSFHHLMVEVDSLDVVGKSLDKVIAGEASSRLSQGLGRHWNDLMISFYMLCPSGFQLEYGFAGKVVDEREVVEVRQAGRGGPSIWGHHPAADAS